MSRLVRHVLATSAAVEGLRVAVECVHICIEQSTAALAAADDFLVV